MSSPIALKVAVIDDEINAVKLLQSKIKELYPEFKVELSANSVEIGIELLNNNECDLLFLDVEIMGGTGFDILSELDDINFDIIFTTAYEHYSIQAIKVSAIDYLIKPYSIEDLKIAIEKSIERKTSGNSDIIKRIGKLFQNQEGLDRLLIKERGRILFIRPENILYIQGDRAYCHINCIGGKKITCSHNLGYFESILLSNRFMRTHRSFLVNLNHVEEYLKSDHQAKLINNDTVMVSSKMQDAFIKALSNLG